MISRQLLRILVLAMPLLVVAFGVLMGGSLLAHATGDTGAAVVLRWIAVAALLAIVTDMILLLGALGLKALEDADDDSEPRQG